MKRTESILYKITNAVSLLSFVGILLIMGITVGDVIMRFVTGRTIIGAYEIVERLLFCAVFASFAYAQIHKGHVHITMVIGILPKNIRMFILGLTGLLSTFMCFTLAYAATIQANMSLKSNYTTGVLKIKLFPFYWLEFATMLVFAFVVLWDAIKCFVGMANEEVANQIDEDLGINQINFQ